MVHNGLWSRRLTALIATFRPAACATGLWVVVFVAAASAQGSQEPFGGGYADLEARRQRLIADWVERFSEVTGQTSTAATFYDSQIRLSARTTFDAVTNALMRTSLTDASGQSMGDALDLIERIEMARGRIAGAAGDQQFRMYVRLTPDASQTLARSREFKRVGDNTVFHKGYPISYRQQGGAPSIQVSIALDLRRADIDVDYRSPGFPAALFNGHLTSANSDVRAGDNYDRHNNRWTGFQNWWGNFFGIRSAAAGGAEDERPGAVPATPRGGRKNIDSMMQDFLTVWLVDHDTLGALSYFSERAYACLTEGDDSAGDKAPFALITALAGAQTVLGPRTSLDGVTVGVRLTMPALKLVTQPHQSRFVIYAVPDDVAAAFDCRSRETAGDGRKIPRRYGKHFGATFYIDIPGGKAHSIALLWAEEAGYWKIVSWQAEPEGDDAPPLHQPPAVASPPAALRADAALVDAARGFLENWLIQENYDAAFRYVSSQAYECANLVRDPGQPLAASLDEAGRQLRLRLEHAGTELPRVRDLSEVIEPVAPVHPAVRILQHRYSTAFTLTGLPDAIADAASCAARTQGRQTMIDAPPRYGRAFGMNLRFRTLSGEAPVLRTLWLHEADGWRIASYDVESP